MIVQLSWYIIIHVFIIHKLVKGLFNVGYEERLVETELLSIKYLYMYLEIW